MNLNYVITSHPYPNQSIPNPNPGGGRGTLPRSYVFPHVFEQNTSNYYIPTNFTFCGSLPSGRSKRWFQFEKKYGARGRVGVVGQNTWMTATPLLTNISLASQYLEKSHYYVYCLCSRSNFSVQWGIGFLKLLLSVEQCSKDTPWYRTVQWSHPWTEKGRQNLAKIWHYTDSDPASRLPNS